ncbi:MAG: prepilin peptidase, partial [Candidatus Omnitrophota bacterium]
MIANIIVFIFGSVVGSFLNVCIYRMPRNESVVWPRSHCPKCSRKILGYDNIPLLSFILLGGRCRFCKGRISLRYPLVELLTALISLALFVRFGL